MRRVVLASVLLLLLAAVSIAEGSNYQIYSEGRGFLGLGGRKVIMLDKGTGDSWIYVNDKWKPIIKEATAETASVDEVNAKLEAEITALKEKQAEDIKALKDKQEQELANLTAKLPAGNPSVAKAAVEPPAVHKTKSLAARKKVEAAKAAKSEEDNSGDEAPPAWLNE